MIVNYTRKQPRLLLVDDEDSIRFLWSVLLKKEGYDVIEASTSQHAFEIIDEEPPDLILADLKIDNHSGIDIMKRAKQRSGTTEIVIVTGYGSIASAVEAMHEGAFTYLTKPVDTGHLILTIQKAYEHRSLFLEVKSLKTQLDDQYGFERIVAESPAMRNVITLARRVAASDATVLIQGESGTGKELLAHCIHRLSDRKAHPFIAINCSAIPEHLLESELFGHVKGSFTGAVADKLGLFEEAHCGSLLLDEIGEMPLALQAKLLRVIQEGEIRRIGDNRNIPIDVRVIAVTNRDLKQRVAENKFREDLFYRLNVIQIEVPPLRFRKDDILPLAQYFLETFSKKMNRPNLRFAQHLGEELCQAPWIGNVRELENAVQRAAILCANDTIEISDLSPMYQDTTAQPSFENKTLEEIEMDVIKYTLKKCNNNQSETAKKLGIGRNTLWRKMKLHKVNPGAENE